MGCFRVLAIVVGLLLLLPGGCFLFIGFGSWGRGGSETIGFIMIGVVILVAAFGLIVAPSSRGKPPPD